MNLAENLKKYRAAKNISQKELAEGISVTPAYIALLETGDRENPSLQVLINICNYLEIGIDMLVEEVS